jgi:hypothetical protein
MESHCIYEVFRPLAKTGARLRIYAEHHPNREEAARRARETNARACGAVRAAVGAGRGSGVIHLRGAAALAAS